MDDAQLLTFRAGRASQRKKEDSHMKVSKLKAALGALALSASLAGAPALAAETTVHHHHTHHHYHHHASGKKKKSHKKSHKKHAHKAKANKAT
jgi:hypothetical protein